MIYMMIDNRSVIFLANFLRQWRSWGIAVNGWPNHGCTETRHVRSAHRADETFFQQLGEKVGKGGTHHKSASMRAHPYRAWELKAHSRAVLSNFTFSSCCFSKTAHSLKMLSSVDSPKLRTRSYIHKMFLITKTQFYSKGQKYPCFCPQIKIKPTTKFVYKN